MLQTKAKWSKPVWRQSHQKEYCEVKMCRFSTPRLPKVLGPGPPQLPPPATLTPPSPGETGRNRAGSGLVFACPALYLQVLVYICKCGLAFASLGLHLHVWLVFASLGLYLQVCACIFSLASYLHFWACICNSGLGFAGLCLYLHDFTRPGLYL